jgi:translation initiation factor 2 alpha subunit (eIF-2alpha)
MAMRKPQWLETGALEFATFEAAPDYAAYAKLNEFDKRGSLHASIISSLYIQKTSDEQYFRRLN